MDIETLGALISFAALFIIWLGAPAGVEQTAEEMAPAPAEA